METTIRREFPRAQYDAPIRYSFVNTEESFNSCMSNYSEGGLCYESNQLVAPKSDVLILMDNYAPGRSGPEGYRSYGAKVRWIKKISQGESNRYATGVQFLVRSHDTLTCAQIDRSAVCDLCGIHVLPSSIETTSTYIQLCAKCSKHYHNLPSGKVKESIERFLIGNVI